MYTDLGNGTMEVTWDRDSTTLPQLNYVITVFDNPEGTGTPLVTENYDYSTPESYNAPFTNKDTIAISSLNLQKRYYLS